MNAEYFVDKSAFARMRHDEVADRIGPLIEEGLVATCALIELEVLYSAKSHHELIRIADDRRLALHWIELSEEVFARALGVQRLLARDGHHRVPIPDLVIAAAAETSELTVIHYDKDFDIIAEVTGQRVEWVVPRGTVG